MDLESYLDEIESRSRETFQARRSLKSFSEYMAAFCENPYSYLRNSAQYTLDMINYFGYEEAERVGLKDRRWKLFDAEFDLEIEPLVGQERVQNAIVRQLQQFAHRGRSEKMLLLHGPNGSSKSTIIGLILAGLEEYSRQDEGILYRFNWMFAERDEKLERIGFDAEDEFAPQRTDTYAYLDTKDTSCRIPCELRDPPIFLIPREERQAFIDRALADHPDRERVASLNYEYFLGGDLSPKSKRIYDSLMTGYHGDWKQVVKHVQVQRYFISSRYRTGAISIEPQGNVDAGSRPSHYEPSMTLPGVLQGSLLIEAFGDLVDANHGVVEYSDFLKRPLETNKYLLTTSEKGTINLSGYTGYLDLVMTGTANEKHLSLFKRSTDFPSFKGRIELIPVPYLLRYSREAELYQRHIGYYSRGRHVTPHTATVAALWAVLTRLRRPSAKNYSPDLAPLVARLTPLEKAMLYDHNEIPLHLKDSERKLLLNNIRRIREELDDTESEFEGIVGAEYEGRRGASPREMLGLLADAAENRSYGCLTPMAVLEQLDKLTKDVSLYEFLRIPVDNGYNDCLRAIEDVKQYYLATVVQEVYASIGLVDEEEYERIFEEYFHHVKAFDLGEKLYLPARSEYVEASEDLMGRIEGLMNINESIEMYRSNLMTKIAAYSLDNPHEPIRYDTLFPDVYNTLKQSFYSERDRVLRGVENNMLRQGSDDFEFLSSTEQAQVVEALDTMNSRYGYCHSCAKDVIAFVLRNTR